MLYMQSFSFGGGVKNNEALFVSCTYSVWMEAQMEVFVCKKKTVYTILYKGVIAFIVQQPKLSQANVLVF